MTEEDDFYMESMNESSVYNSLNNLFNSSEAVKSLNLTKEKLYCNTDEWNNFLESYKPVHGCCSLSVCIFGSIANIINIIVLTRPSMISPTNAILTALAITDLLVMVEYIPFTLHQYILTGRDLEIRLSWDWAVFVLFHAQFALVVHTISISLTVTLAVWRYIAIGYPQHNTVWCSMFRSYVGIVICFLFSIVCNVPTYINLDIQENNLNNSTYYIVHIADERNGTWNTINFIVYSVVLKLMPCVALTALSFGLIKELLKAARRRASLMKRAQNGKKAEAEKQADRVTRMLLAILILFLISEVPQGILGLLYVLPGMGFTKCYEKLGEIMDMLVLFNSAVNFLLYCSMSQQFRNTFTKLFNPCSNSIISRSIIVKKWRQVPLTESATEFSTTCVTHV